MRKHFLCSVAAIPIITAISGPVAAADQAMRVKAPALHVPTWTGFYLGGHLGYGRAKFHGLADSGGDQIVADGPRVSGLALGFHTGFNQQVGQWLYGIEGDVTATPGWEKRICSFVPGSVCDNNFTYGKLDALASIRGRLGMTFDRTLIYATGGVGFAKKTSEAGSNDWRYHYGVKVGGVFGGGIEWKHNPNLSLRLEGLHYIFSDSHPDSLRGGFFLDHGIKNATVIRAGASWHPEGGFWGKGPVVAANPAMVVKAPALSVPAWTGFYLGGHLGYGWAKFRGAADGGGSEALRVDPRVHGFALGLHTGFNQQTGQWLYGIEGDVTATPGWEKRICSFAATSACDDNFVYGKLDALASIRGRLGMTFDRTLIYATGGVAFARKASQAGSNDWRYHYGVKVGGVFGGGIEWKYNPNLSLRLEGLHYIFSDKHPGSLRTDFFIDHGIKNATVIRAGASWHPEGGLWGKGPVAAADPAMRGKSPALPVPAWTGFYLGGHLGYGWAKFRGVADGGGSEALRTDPRVHGFALGLHTGFNQQAGQWLYGIEGDVTATPGWEKRICSFAAGNYICEDNFVYGKLDALASVRARLGMTFDRTLIYATGGVGFAKKASEAGSNDWRYHYGIKVGGVFGGGIEWKYNPNLSLRLEGLHYIFSDKHPDSIRGGFVVDHGIKNATVIRAGASWHFDGGGLWGKGPVVGKAPVAARY